MSKLIPFSLHQKICCPVCGYNCNENVFSRYSSTEVAAHICPPGRNADRNLRILKNIEGLWNGTESYLVKCNNCTFLFGFPYVGGNEEFYSILHEQYGYPKWRIEYTLAINNALSNLQRGNILDIGAGTGMFLRSLGSNWQKFAVEGSDTTRALLSEAGIDTYTDIETLTLAMPKKISVVTIFQVLEHLSNFKAVIKNIHELLIPGGYLIISVPDGQDMLLQEEILGCPDFPPNHINKWTLKSLSMVLEENGFFITRSMKTPGSLNELKGAIHVKLIERAAKNKRSFAAKVYTIKKKNVRVVFLSILAVFEFFNLLPHVKQLYKGRTLFVIAQSL